MSHYDGSFTAYANHSHADKTAEAFESKLLEIYYDRYRILGAFEDVE